MAKAHIWPNMYDPLSRLKAWELEHRRFFPNRLDVLVNNAGVYKFLPLEEITEDEFHREFNINVLGTLLATKEAVKYFGPNGGSAINMSSIASAGEANAPIYSGTKGAVDAITRGLATELGPRKMLLRQAASRPRARTAPAS